MGKEEGERSKGKGRPKKLDILNLFSMWRRGGEPDHQILSVKYLLFSLIIPMNDEKFDGKGRERKGEETIDGLLAVIYGLKGWIFWRTL